MITVSDSCVGEDSDPNWTEPSGEHGVTIVVDRGDEGSKDDHHRESPKEKYPGGEDDAAVSECEPLVHRQHDPET